MIEFILTANNGIHDIRTKPLEFREGLTLYALAVLYEKRDDILLGIHLVRTDSAPYAGFVREEQMKENAITTSIFAYLRILDNILQVRLESASEIMVATEFLKIMAEHWPAWNGAFRQRLEMFDDDAKFGGRLRNLSTELQAQCSSDLS